MQGTQVWALVWEDPIRHEATKPIATTNKPVLWSPPAATAEVMCREHVLQKQEKPLRWQTPAPQWRVASFYHN